LNKFGREASQSIVLLFGPAVLYRDVLTFDILFIQRAERRDTQAIHAKLDELLRAEGQARSELTTLDEREPEEIIEHRDEERARSSDR
jgi:low affinity Fe/Cu permease